MAKFAAITILAAFCYIQACQAEPASLSELNDAINAAGREVRSASLKQLGLAVLSDQEQVGITGEQRSCLWRLVHLRTGQLNQALRLGQNNLRSQAPSRVGEDLALLSGEYRDALNAIAQPLLSSLQNELDACLLAPAA